MPIQLQLPPQGNLQLPQFQPATIQPERGAVLDYSPITQAMGQIANTIMQLPQIIDSRRQQKFQQNFELQKDKENEQYRAESLNQRLAIAQQQADLKQQQIQKSPTTEWDEEASTALPGNPGYFNGVSADGSAPVAPPTDQTPGQYDIPPGGLPSQPGEDADYAPLSQTKPDWDNIPTSQMTAGGTPPPATPPLAPLTEDTIGLDGKLHHTQKPLAQTSVDNSPAGGQMSGVTVPATPPATASKEVKPKQQSSQEVGKYHRYGNELMMNLTPDGSIKKIFVRGDKFPAIIHTKSGEPSKLSPAYIAAVNEINKTAKPSEKISLFDEDGTEKEPAQIGKEVVAYNKAHKDDPDPMQEDTENLAKMIADYKIPAPNLSRAISSKNPVALKAITEAARINPKFSTITYAAMQASAKDFSAGKTSIALTQLRTALGHLAQAHDTVTNLRNTDNTWYNSGKNLLARGFGDADVTNFNTAVGNANTEIQSAIKGGIITNAETERSLKNLSSSSSPKQIEGAMSELRDLIVTRLRQQADKYKTNFGTDLPGGALGNDDARDALRSLGGDPDKVEGKEPDSKPAGTIDKPVVLQSKEDYDKLPVGSYYMGENGPKIKK